MYVPLQLYHYDLFILMWSLFLRVWFLEVLFHTVMWRGVPHTYQVCVWSLSLCRCVGARARGPSPGQMLYIGLCPASARHWAGVDSMLGRVVDGWPALIRHWFDISCLLGSLHNFNNILFNATLFFG